MFANDTKFISSPFSYCIGGDAVIQSVSQQRDVDVTVTENLAWSALIEVAK